MNVSSRCDYAVRAVIDLARYAPGGNPQTATEIAERERIPETYLVHILLNLKRGGIVQSVRGAQGGYMLGRSPAAISLLDVITAVDGPILDPIPGAESPSEEVKLTWRKVARKLTDSLREITIQSLLDESAKADMYFI
jgi:Rrf2 family protein